MLQKLWNFVLLQPSILLVWHIYNCNDMHILFDTVRYEMKALRLAQTSLAKAANISRFPIWRVSMMIQITPKFDQLFLVSLQSFSEKCIKICP